MNPEEAVEPANDNCYAFVDISHGREDPIDEVVGMKTIELDKQRMG